jgi:hypothetical protein
MGIRHKLSIPADHFTIIRNDWLRDERLSWKARGLVAYLASHRVGWETSLEQLARAGKDGKDAVATGLKELVDLGYLKINRQRDEHGKVSGTDYDLTDPWDQPKPDFPDQVQPDRDFPDQGNPLPKKTSSSEDQIEEDQDYSTAVAVRGQEPNAGQLVGEWIDSCAHRPPSRVIGQVSKETKALLTDGVSSDVVRRTLVAWQERGLHPSTLASVAHELMNASPTRGRMGKQAQQQAETDALFDRAMQRARARDAADEVAKGGTSPQLPLKGIW